MSPRAARIWALIAPPIVVALVTLDGGNAMIYAAGQVLLGLWITMLGALIILALDAQRMRVSVWDRVDVLTSTGAVMMATSSAVPSARRSVNAITANTLSSTATANIMNVARRSSRRRQFQRRQDRF